MSRNRLFFTGITLFFLVGAGVAWVLSNQGIIQNSWAPPLGIAFSVLSVLVAFVQWTLPLPSTETKASAPSTESGYAQEVLYKQIYDRLTEGNGALVVYEKRKHIGENICVKSYSSHDEKEANIVERTANGLPLFAAVFLNLKPDEYYVHRVAMYHSKDVTVYSGEIAELDWRRDIEKEEKEEKKQRRILTALRVNSSFIGLGGVLFLTHRYMMIPYLDIAGIIGIGLGVVNLLSIFFMSWLGWLETDEFVIYPVGRSSLFVAELGGALFIAHRSLLVPYLDIAGIILMALGGLIFVIGFLAFVIDS